MPNVPVGLKPVSSSIVPASAWNSSSAFGLAIENACCVSAPSIDADGFVSVITASVSLVASQLLYSEGERSSLSFWA